MSFLALFAAILAFIALLRTGSLGALERRIQRLEQLIAQLRRELAGARESAGQIDVPAPEAPAAGRAGATEAPRAPAPAAAPPSPPARARPQRPARGPRPPRVDIDWERWIGARGAAVLGGIVLALAGLYFFQYSIEHGLIPPWLRVVSATLFGVGCIAAAELRARPRYGVTANALDGGGIAVLYAAFWAAHTLYALIGPQTALVLMVVVTVACAALAYRHDSLVIAMIGLVGGFATPLLLATGEDRPISLFAYILLLDGGLLFIAQRRGWPLLALLSLVGTIAYQALWIGARMQEEQLLLALAVLGVFAVAYAFALRSLPAQGRRPWLITQGGAALFPFVFALALAGRAELGTHFYPLGVLLAVLSACACWLARTQGRAWLGLGAATGTTAVAAMWLLRQPLDSALAWEAAASCLLLAAVFHVFVELDRDEPGSSGPAPAAMVSALGLHALLVGAAIQSGGVALWPWLLGWLGLTALSLRHGGFARRGPLQPAAAAAMALGLWLYRIENVHAEPALPLFAALVLLLALAGQVLALLRGNESARSWSEHAAAGFALLMVLALGSDPAFSEHVLVSLGGAALLGLAVVLCATRLPEGRWALAATGATAWAHWAWTQQHATLSGDSAAPALAMAFAAATLLVFAAWPFVAFPRLRGERWAWYASALAGPLWFPSLRELWLASFGDAAIGILPLALAALALGCARRTLQVREQGDPRRQADLVWFLAVGLGFVTLAIPLQLEKEWITIAWALEGLALVWLWRRFDHPGLKWLALALFAGVTLRLVANEAVLGYYPRPDWRIVNWLFYTYLVPVAAMLTAVRLLAAHEVARAREWERSLYGPGRALVAGATGLAAIVIGFVWINLAIADWFATGDTLRVALERMSARDLARSICWAIYALLLLGAGVRIGSGALRWLSLGLIMVTVVKVFLYDLGELEDLYRVASLLGLATSLILISLAYQRFVVRPASEES